MQSNRYKRKRRKARQTRARIGNKNCKTCGKTLKDTLHHYFCNDCWKERRGVL